MEAVVQTPGGRVEYEGLEHIDGVPGSAAPIALNFFDCSGAVCGSLLPTGNVVDRIQEIAATYIDNGMPIVAIQAADLGCTGYETCTELEKKTVLEDMVQYLTP